MKNRARSLFIFALLLLPLRGFAADVSSHLPIVIQSDGDFIACACVSVGDGSPAHPYVIGPWMISAAAGPAVAVDGAALTKSFILYNLKIAGRGVPNANGIVVKNVNTAGG